jgi:uncharacterized peroxidase-related enzyme
MMAVTKPMEPIYLRDVENNPQPSAYADLIKAAQANGSEYWQIWHLLAFRPEMTIHLGRFTHALMFEPGPIPPSLRELIAAYTSSLNECPFCMRSHAAVTSHLLHDEGLVRQVLEDLDSSPLPEDKKVLLRFVRKVTYEPFKIREEDMRLLHEAGWDDASIYYAITVSALFNFYNRWISASGVHPVSTENHWLHAAKIAERGYTR